MSVGYRDPRDEETPDYRAPLRSKRVGPWQYTRHYILKANYGRPVPGCPDCVPAEARDE